MDHPLRHLASSAAPRLRRLALLALCAGLAACGTLAGREPPRVNVVDMAPLSGGDLELRFVLALRVQNPSDRPLDYHGLSLVLDVNERTFASGVSDARGRVPAFGEALVRVPMSVTALTVLKQAWGMAQGPAPRNLRYRLSGRLGGGLLGGVRFIDEGTLDGSVFDAPANR